MKQRFSSLDVSASVAELAPQLVGLRLQNVYDINAKTYLFKFSRSDTKELLLIESGIRMHTTQFAREKSNTPSNFCMKLRKHLRTRRLTAMRQLGADRAIDLQFSEGEFAFHVIVEFYASGNIILTDSAYNILSVLRVVELENAPAAPATATAPATANAGAAARKNAVNDEHDVSRIAVGQIYNVESARALEPITPEKLLAALLSANATDEPGPISVDSTNQIEASNEAAADEQQQPQQQQQQASGKKSKHDKKGSSARGKDNQPEPSASKKKKKKNTKTLRAVLRDKLGADYGTALVEHCTLISGLDPNTMLPDAELETPDSDKFMSLLQAFQQGDSIVLSCITSPQRGYIVLSNFNQSSSEQNAKPATSSAPSLSTLITYDEFHPFLFAQFKCSPFQGSESTEAQADVQLPVTEFASFDKCVDEFFSKIESQKLEMRARQAELAALKKIENAKASHDNQIRNFQIVQETSFLFAQAIEFHLVAIDSVLNTVRSFLASGMDWKDLEDLVRDEAAQGNPLARMIVAFRLDAGMITVGLRNPELGEEEDDDDDDSDEEDSNQSDSDHRDISAEDSAAEKKRRAMQNKRKQQRQQELLESKKREILKVDLDIYASAYANARRYYEAKKVAASKEEKTLIASTKALKSTEHRIQKDLAMNQQTAVTISKIRKPHWFEKFIWFISSENYLVVGGRDASQNELLVRRYLKKGDVYVHADMHGAASVIVKNIQAPAQPATGSSDATASTSAALPPTDESHPIPPTTLLQAGTMSVCQSRAWDAKIVTAAYWVHAHQVSKTAPTGEFLTQGSFMIRGKKNWLPPVQLVYGVALLFKVDETCIGRHFWERRPWGRDGATGSLEMLSASADDVKLVTRGGDDESAQDDAAAEEGETIDGDDTEAIDEVADVDDEPDAIARNDEYTETQPNEPESVDDDDDNGLRDDLDDEEIQVESMQDQEDGKQDDDGDDDNADNADEVQMQQEQEQDQAVSSSTRTPFDSKYDYDDTGANDFDGDDLANDSALQRQSQQPSGKKHLSAKERRLLKKAKSGILSADPGEDSAVQSPSMPASRQPSASNSTVDKTKPPAAPVRGKKGKLKKLKDKYADQDEEERELSLDLLGSAKGPQPKGKKAKAQLLKKQEDERRKAQSNAEFELRKSKREAAAQSNAASAARPVSSSESQSRDQPVEAADDALDDVDQHPDTAIARDQDDTGTNAGDSALVKRMLEEENVALLDDDQVANMSYLDSLTGQPHPDDILLHAIPVCAPWIALQKYKIKAKLLPGSLKRGKAAKSAAAAFATIAGNDGGPFGERQKELVRVIPEAEWTATMMGKVKIVLPGADQASSKKGSAKKHAQK